MNEPTQPTQPKELAKTDGQPPVDTFGKPGKPSKPGNSGNLGIKGPILKYHGGKWSLSHNYAEILSFPPVNQIARRVHPFGGGLGELFLLPYEGVQEIVADTDRNITNFFWVLKNKKLFNEFVWLCNNTPFSQNDFDYAAALLNWPESFKADYVAPNLSQDETNVVWRAWAVFVVFRQSMSGRADTWQRCKRVRRGMSESVSAFLNAVDGLTAFHERLMRIEVHTEDFRSIIPRYDDDKTLFFCDPPYLESTRQAKKVYNREMTVEDHKKLLDIAMNARGFFAICGYPSDLYDSLLTAERGWKRHEFPVNCHGAAASGKVTSKRLECLWTNF